MPWRSLPPVIVAVDVETTGVTRQDRIASIGMVRLETAGLARGDLVVDAFHAYCNPGRISDPMARAVHGISDQFLGQQAPFADLADAVCDFIRPARAILAHNAAFDRRFLMQEHSLAGRVSSFPPWVCTLEVGGGSLTSCCASIGLSRVGAHHGALEDAWLALMVYLACHGAPRELICPMPDALAAIA